MKGPGKIQAHSPSQVFPTPINLIHSLEFAGGKIPVRNKVRVNKI